MRQFTTLVLIGLLVHAAKAQGQRAAVVAEVDSSRLARIDSLFAPYDRSDAPGYAVGIVQRGTLVYARGFGSANLDYRVPITRKTVFNVASLSKQFTAACIAILIRQGKLSLEDDIRRYFAEMPNYPDTIRVKHLVYMTSGLPEYYTVPRPGGRTWDLDYFTVDDAIRATFAQGDLRFAPGTRWAYSNINYMLLAKIVERVSGVGFGDFARTEIFERLGMTDSHINVDLGRVVANRAIGYNLRSASPGYQSELRRSPHFGGSGLFTTLDDLARWDRSFTSHELGGPELTSLLLSTMKFEHDKANDAFGLVWGRHKGHRTIWYEGGDLGFSSYMVRFPDAHLTLIVLSNLGTGRAADHARRVLDILLP